MAHIPSSCSAMAPCFMSHSTSLHIVKLCTCDIWDALQWYEKHFWFHLKFEMLDILFPWVPSNSSWNFKVRIAELLVGSCWDACSIDFLHPTSELVHTSIYDANLILSCICVYSLALCINLQHAEGLVLMIMTTWIILHYESLQ